MALEEEPKAKGSKDVEKELPYWISTSRRTGFKRFHKKSWACGVMHWKVTCCDEVAEVPKSGVDAWCRICFKAELDEQEDEDSSRSGSSSSTAEDE